MHHAERRFHLLLRRFLPCLLVFLLVLPINLLAEEEKSGEEEEGGLDLEAPQLETPPSEEGLQVGPISNINFGGLLDVRYVLPSTTAGSMVIHVNELVITANVTDNISLLLEQLLPTSDMESLVGDDHGFATALISGLPLLPTGTAIKIGRYRFKYGIDAQLDSPANPVYSLVRKNLGFISDKGIELSGFFGPVSYYISALNGPDHVEKSAYDKEGHPIGVIKDSISNNSKPIALRLSAEPLRSLKTGLSYFEGVSWQYVNRMETMGEHAGMEAAGKHAFGGVVDRSAVIFKRRYTADASYRFWKLDFLGEYTRGQDFLGRRRANVTGYYFRTDFSLFPNKFTLLAQYDFWDDGRDKTLNEDALSFAATYYLKSQVFLRIAYLYNQLREKEMDNIVVTQLYFPY